MFRLAFTPLFNSRARKWPFPGFYVLSSCSRPLPVLFTRPETPFLSVSLKSRFGVHFLQEASLESSRGSPLWLPFPLSAQATGDCSLGALNSRPFFVTVLDVEVPDQVQPTVFLLELSSGLRAASSQGEEAGRKLWVSFYRDRDPIRGLTLTTSLNPNHPPRDRPLLHRQPHRGEGVTLWT